MKNHMKSISVIAIILALWFLFSSLNIWSAYVLPSPYKVFDTFIKMCKSGEIFTHIWDSLLRVIIGFSIAFVLAFSLGVLSSIKPNSAPYYNHIVEFIRNVPPLSLIPLLILWFGIGETSKIIVIVLTSFFPMFLNTKKKADA